MPKSERKIGLDILRIFSMLGIIGLHLIGQGGLLANLSLNDSRFFIILFVYVICYLSVDIFGILSGFFSWKKNIVNYSRIFELIFITFFYSVIVTVIFYFFNLYGYRTAGFKEIIVSLFPILINEYWYVTCYVFLFFLIPYLNYLLHKLDKKNVKNLLIILFILLSLLPNVFFQVDFFRVLNGYSPVWLVYCYLLGGYIGKYGLKIKSLYKCLFYFFICIVCAFLLNIIVRIVTFKVYGQVFHDSWFINYISPFILIGSILSVFIFSKINFNNFKFTKFIPFLSTCSFAVYVIHTNYLVYNFFIKNIMLFSIKHNIVYILISFFAILFIVYFVCSIIEYFRIKIFELLKINFLIKLIGKKVNNFLN